MVKKKILITSVSFFPRISPRSFRATELAKEFARQGHDVTVLTNKQKIDYSDFSKAHKINIEDFTGGKWKEIKGNNIITKGLRFLLNLLFLYPDIQLTSLLRKKLKKKSGYDLLISIARPYPVHWGVALAKKRDANLCNIWIADCGDPFMGNKEIRLKLPFYFRFVENWFCNKPDYITVPIKDAIEAYPSICRNKIEVIPQGFSFSNPKLFNQKIETSYPVFAYAGLLSKGIRDPGPFLEYLCTKIDDKFKFIIYTQNLSVLEPYKNKLGIKLEIRNYVPREQLLKEISSMNFLVNFENKNNVQSPSKLIDYALTKRPILSINPANLNKKIVDEFMKGDYTGQFVFKDIEQYNIKNVVSQFLSLSNTKNLK